MTALLLLLMTAALAVAPTPWPGKVRVEGPEASGDGPSWDPALTDRSPAADRELAWDAAEALRTRPGAWYQRIALVRLFRPPHTIAPDVLDADATRLATWFHEHGWHQAAATWKLSPGHGPKVRDVDFVVVPGPRDPTWHRSLAKPAPPHGWDVQPVVSALGRGTALSVYGGVYAEWRQREVARPNALLFHGEVGFRAFPEVRAEGLHVLPIRFHGNLGLWSDLRAGWSRGIGGDVETFAEVRGRTDLWPAVNEAEPSGRFGLRWNAKHALTLEAALRGGLWTSWAWPPQRDAYDPWFGGTPLSPDQRQFAPTYTYAHLDLAAVLDTTDRRVDPRRGVRIALHTTPFGLAATAPFYRAELDVRAFAPLAGERWTLAVKGRAGGLDWEDPTGRGLLGERFYLGVVDMRGWGRREVMPPGYPGDPYDLRPGGNLVTYGNLTLRWHVHRDLTLAAFADTGRVWERWSQVTFDQLLWDVGLSGAVPSPLGQIRLDVAVRLNEQPIDGSIPVGLQLRLNPPW